MIDLKQFEQDFRSWVRSAPLPALITALEVLADEFCERGQRAKDFGSRAWLDALVRVTSPDVPPERAQPGA